MELTKCQIGLLVYYVAGTILVVLNNRKLFKTNPVSTSLFCMLWPAFFAFHIILFTYNWFMPMEASDL